MKISKTPVRAAAILVGSAGVATVAWLAIPAGAATIGNVSVSGTKVVYTAATNKVNAVAVTRSGNTITIDDGQQLKAGTGCVAVSGDKTKVRCTPAATPTGVQVDLGDGNDVLVNLTDLPLTAFGRAGSDRITGGPAGDAIQAGDGGDVVSGLGGNDTVLSQGGNDAVAGGDGDDFIHGGAGNDRIAGGTGDDGLWGDDGNDTEDGGSGDDAFLEYVDYAPGTDADTFTDSAGDDFVSYSERRTSVTIDADGVTGDDGRTGERDTIPTGIETLFGGSGSDRMLGTPAEELFLAGDGNDVVTAGAGDDILAGERGKDTLDGGAGDDDFCTDTEADVILVSCERSTVGGVIDITELGRTKAVQTIKGVREREAALR